MWRKIVENQDFRRETVGWPVKMWISGMEIDSPRILLALPNQFISMSSDYWNHRSSHPQDMEGHLGRSKHRNLGNEEQMVSCMLPNSQTNTALDFVEKVPLDLPSFKIHGDPRCHRRVDIEVNLPCSGPFTKQMEIQVSAIPSKSWCHDCLLIANMVPGISQTTNENTCSINR
jgi:hypothetical protein